MIDKVETLSFTWVIGLDAAPPCRQKRILDIGDCVDEIHKEHDRFLAATDERKRKHEMERWTTFELGRDLSHRNRLFHSTVEYVQRKVADRVNGLLCHRLSAYANEWMHGDGNRREHSVSDDGDRCIV